MLLFDLKGIIGITTHIVIASHFSNVAAASTLRCALRKVLDDINGKYRGSPMTPVSIWTEEMLSNELRNRRGDEWIAQAVEFLQCVWKAVGMTRFWLARDLAPRTWRRLER